MENKPLISVIVPVYNVQKYVRKSVESILQQTYKNLEIILVDDGSTDESGKICDTLARSDNRVTVIHKKNGGLSDARNAGLDRATGELIGFVDSDDYIEKNMYEVLEERMRINEADISCCGRYVVQESDGTKTPYFILDREQILSPCQAIGKLLIWDGCDSAAWDKLYKVKLFKGRRYPFGVLHEDLNFLFFCATHNLNRKRNRIVLVMLLVESIVVALSVNCTTGMISFFIFALLIVTKDRIYSIVEKPTFFVLLTIGLDLLLVVNSAVLSIPVISNFITNTLGKDITLTGRMGAYARFFLMMSGHYLLGYGLDHNYWVCLKGLTSNSLLPIYNAQNGIFDSIVSYGLIGTILVFLVSCEMIKKGRKKSDYAFLCGIYVFGMLSMVEVTLNLKFIILLAFVGLAWEKEKVQDNNDEW